MAKITNPSKLLASSKSSAITKIGKSNILAKTSPFSKGLLATRQSKDASDANNKLVNIDKFLKSDLIVSQKKAEVKRKKKEKQDFDEAEKKLETPQSKKFKLPGFNLPSLGFMDRVKRFLFFTALGWLLPKIIEFLPKLEGFAKIVGGIYKFAEGLFGNLFNGFMSLVKFGGDLKDKTLGFIASAKAGVGGNYQKEFDKLEKQFNTFANASIIAGLVGLDMGLAGLDEYNKQRKKGQKPVAGKPGEKPKPSGKPKVTTGKGGEKPSGKPKVTTGKGGKVPGWWNRIFKGPFAKLKGPLSRFAGAAVPGLGAVVGAADAKARFAVGDKIGGALASVSAALDAATVASALTGVGIPVAGILGSISMGIDVILLIRDILSLIPFIPKNLLGFSRGGKVVKRYQGGGTTRGGRPVGGPKRRTITPTRRKPPRVTIPKTQPGKDVGGEKKVKEFYAKPEDPNKKYTAQAGGWLANLGKERQDLSAFDTLKKMSGTLKSDETLAKGILGVMSSGIDMALGQKPDKKVFKAFFDSIGYIADTLANQRTSKSMSSLRSQIGAFAEGGTIPSRGLRGTYSDANTGDMLAKLIGPTIDQRVNEAIQSIEKQLQMKGAPGPGVKPGADPGAAGAGGYAEGEKNFVPSKEIYDYLKSKGVSHNHAMGMLANIQAESSFNAGAIGDNGTSGGLFQHHAERFSGMVSFAGKDWAKNWKRQVDYALREDAGKQYVEKQFKNAEEASAWFTLNFERPSNKETKARQRLENLKNFGADGSWKGSQPGVTGFEPGTQVTGGVLPSTKLGSSAGMRQHPISGEFKMHSGNDYPMPEGTPVSLTKGGVVTRSEINGSLTSGYGNLVEIRHPDGSKSVYAHLSNRKVGVGDKVNPGAVIGNVGSTGGSTGPHLHFEYDGKDGTTITNASTLNSLADQTFRFGNVKPSAAYKLSMKDGKEGVIENGVWKSKTWTTEEKERYQKTKQVKTPTATSIKPQVAGGGMGGKRGSGTTPQMQGGGLVSPSKPNRVIPSSFASYETPGGGMMIAIQPMIIEKPVPVSGGGGKMIAFPVPVAVNSNMDLSLSRG